MVGSSFRFLKGILILFSTVVLLIGSVDAGEDDWPRFRGSGGAGIASSFDCPGGVDKTSRAWSVALPGPGTSSPVVWGQRIFVTSEDRLGGVVHLQCLFLMILARTPKQAVIWISSEWVW